MPSRRPTRRVLCSYPLKVGDTKSGMLRRLLAEWQRDWAPATLECLHILLAQESL